MCSIPYLAPGGLRVVEDVPVPTFPVLAPLVPEVMFFETLPNSTVRTL